MLITIVHGKGRRVRLPEGSESASWREVFKQYEDLLTGAVFGRLRYLSKPMFTLVIERLIGPVHASTIGDLKSFEFWPNLVGLDGRSRVQPDVLINFENATVLIEVKPPNGGPQSVGQRSEQLGAFSAECWAGRREASVVHYVALGRNAPARDDVSGDQPGDAATPFDLSIHRHEWDVIVAAISEWLTKGRLGELKASPTDISVLEDIEDSLGLFEIRPKVLLPWPGLSNWAARHPLQASAFRLWPSGTQIPMRGASAPLADWKSLARYAAQNLGELHEH